MPEVKIDPIDAHMTWSAWDQLRHAETIRDSDPVSMSGRQLVDGAAYGLLKAEFMAAHAGVVPWVPLPGGGQGVLTVGAALDVPASQWPQPELAHLYMLNQRTYAAMHATCRRARPGDTPLPRANVSPLDVQKTSTFFEAVGSGAATMGLAPVAWLIIAAVGILATIAAAYYATTTKLEQIAVDAKLARDAAAIGSLTDLASKQLAMTGKIDPSLVRAIGATGSTISAPSWAYLAIGGGGALLLASGVWIALKLRKGRR